jgi:hypothetical protein
MTAMDQSSTDLFARLLGAERAEAARLAEGSRRAAPRAGVRDFWLGDAGSTFA